MPKLSRLRILYRRIRFHRTKPTQHENGIFYPMRFMPNRLHSLPRCQARYAHSNLQKWRKSQMPRRKLKTSSIEAERERFKQRRKQYLKKKQSDARIARTNNEEIKQYQANIKRAKREIKLYERAIDVLLTIQKVTKGK